MHQVIWAKLLGTLIGTTAHAQAAVFCVFMGGLALGSILFGRRADRLGRPLRTYVILEFAIALYCLLLPLVVHIVGIGYVALASHALDAPRVIFLIRFGLVILCVLLPAILMGGTLPILARTVIGNVGETRSRVGALYALNSIGAVAGAGVAGFISLPILGVYGSLGLASLMNLLAGAILWKPAKLEVAPEGAEKDESHSAAGPLPSASASGFRPIQMNTTLVALALSGFAAMGYEVLFSRVISLSFGSSTYSFSVMLMAFITGISIGSAVMARVNVKRPLLLLGLSQLMVVVAFMAITPLISRLPYLIGLQRIALQNTDFGFELYQLSKGLLCLAVLLIPTLCLGLSFPLVAQIQVRSSADIGSRVGTTYAWNTFGNVLGAVLTSLVLLPAFGLLTSFHINFSLNLAAGLLILAIANEVRAALRATAVAVAAAAIGIYGVTAVGWLDPLQMSRNHLRMTSGPDEDVTAEERQADPSTSFAAWKDTYLTLPESVTEAVFEEDEYASVLATKGSDDKVLYVNTKADASSAYELPTQLMLAHIPMFMNLDAKSLLVIGHGSGITTGSALRHPVERVDVVEISKAVLAVDHIFENDNYHVLSDPRVNLHLEDAQSYCAASTRSTMSSSPSPQIRGWPASRVCSQSSSTSFYTTD